MFSLRLKEDEALIPSAITTGLLMVSVVFLLVSAVSIYLRFYVRRNRPRDYGWDDTWLIIAWVSTFAIAILVWVCTGISRVNYCSVDKKKGEFMSSLLILTSSVIVQLPLGAVKVFVLLFYQRVFPTSIFKLRTWIAIVIVTVWGVLFFFLTLFQKRYYSDLLNGTGEWLLDSSSVGLAQVGSSIALHVIVLTFPRLVIYRLNMQRSRKIAVALVFWLGAFCVVTAILRLVYLNMSIREISKDHSRLYLQSNILSELKWVQPMQKTPHASIGMSQYLFSSGALDNLYYRGLRPAGDCLIHNARLPNP